MTDANIPEPEFSFPVDILALPASGRTYTIKASPEERARVAVRLAVAEVKALSAEFEVKPAAGAVKVTGHVNAEVVQTCVVSLVPVNASISEDISVSYITEERAAKEKAARAKAASTSKGKKAQDEADEEEAFTVGDADPPEVAQNGRIDLGEVAVVHTALGLDPYPRAPGAAFDAKVFGLEPEKAEKAPDTSPFAALADLKKPRS